MDPPIAHGGEESYRAYPTGPQDRYPLLIQFRHVLERDREKGHGIVDVPVPGTGGTLGREHLVPESEGFRPIGRYDEGTLRPWA